MGSTNRFPTELTQWDNYKYFCEFDRDQVTTEWTITVTDTGTITNDNLGNGQAVVLPSDGTVADNDEAYAITANLNFQFANGKPHYFAAYAKYAEAATNAANIYLGFINVVAANTLVDNGAGMVTTFDGAVIGKFDGDTTWSLVTSRGATQTKTKSQNTAGGTSFSKFEIYVNDFSSTQCSITAKVDGQYLVDTNGFRITHYVLYSGALVTGLGFGAKNGSANQQELDVDWVLGERQR